MKKIITSLLVLAMVLSVFAGVSTPAKAEAPADALYYWSFEDASGLTAVTQVDKAEDSINDGANFDIAPCDHPIMIAEGQGASGNALYLDGKYGVKLDDLASIDTDCYTISFWVNADRLSTFGPVVQMGRNIGDSGDDRTVTWINFTKSTWGTNGAALFPVAWNRNSSIGTDVNEGGVWPWISGADDAEHGKREWCLVTIVMDGVRYTADDNMDRIGTKYYLNGELMFDASPEFMFYQGVAPEILTGDGVEGYIGINYWDTIFKGFIDELTIYGKALTAEEVKALYDAGTAPEKPVAPSLEDIVVETEPAALAAAPVDAAAIDTLGTPDRVLGFWTDNTDGYELADGATVTMKLNNYSNGETNWNNFVICLTNTPVKTDLLASAENYEGYAEYVVIRADAWGWGEGFVPEGSFEMSWTDWAQWLNLMTDAEVTLVLTRDGGVVTIDFTFTGADGTVMTEKATVNSTMTAESPVYAFLGGEGAYIELLSVE